MLHSDSPVTTYRAADFSDLVSCDLVLICIASYLPAPSLLSLSSASRYVRSSMHTTPGVWRIIDLSDLYRHPEPDAYLVKFLRQSYVARDCRTLILDGLSIDHIFLDQLILREMPAIHYISLSSCPNLNGDQLIKLIDYIRRPSAPRPLSLRRISLLGAPLFPLNQPSVYAPFIVAAAGDEICTDLHFLQCFGRDHIDRDIAKHQWHLKVKYPNHPCVECNVPQEVCMNCHVNHSCKGCHSFYCDQCEPYPKVSISLSTS